MKRICEHVAFVALILLIGAGCDTQEQQKDFLDDAFSPPSGFTRTDADGRILSDDKDDWRTAPIYTGRVLIDPAFPNPVSGAFIAIPVRVREFNAVPGGLEVVSFDENQIPRRLDAVREASDPGAYVLSFNPTLLDVRGLVRVFILDGRGEMVSYGDILID